MTGAPSVVGKITFDPPLSPLKQQLVHDVPMGNAVRLYAVYSWPWWRSHALSGSFTDEGTGAVLQFGLWETWGSNQRMPDCACPPMACAIPTGQRQDAVRVRIVPDCLIGPDCLTAT